MRRLAGGRLDRRALLTGLLAIGAVPAWSAGAAARDIDPSGDVYRLARMTVFGTPRQAREALIGLGRLGRADAVPGLILARRYGPLGRETDQLLAALTGNSQASSWDDWMVWQQTHPEVRPHVSFARLKLDVLSRIDLQFHRLLASGEQLRTVRLEEITWRGVKVDAIRALTDPALVVGSEAGFMNGDDFVFGVEFDGHARAYPLKIMDWHEILNDFVGGRPVTLVHCPLSGTAALYGTAMDGQAPPLKFRGSGLVYRSTMLMVDGEGGSLWDPLLGQPLAGPLAGSDLRLTPLPLTLTRWSDWRIRHPETSVLSIETGFGHAYLPGAADAGYAESDSPAFPVAIADFRMAPKDLVFGLRLPEGDKAWPLTAFADDTVINDDLNGAGLVLLGNARDRTVRAYRRDGQAFQATSSPLVLFAGEQGVWRVTEAALQGPNGAALPRLAGPTASWFAWADRVGGGTPLFAPGSVPTD
ncbi:MAG: DUF3179 domain-containing protein [Inquilinus sp.]|nr:DUF3179 domain-containing protein [Inquilinus sp.]